jgi:hypothetical protein
VAAITIAGCNNIKILERARVLSMGVNITTVRMKAVILTLSVLRERVIKRTILISHLIREAEIKQAVGATKAAGS